MLQFVKIGAGIRHRAPRLLIRRAEFLIFQANQHLAFFYLVAFFHADPRQTAGDFGVHVDGVMGHDVAGGREHGAARVVAAGFRGGSDDLDFRDVGGERAIGQSDQPSSTTTAMPTRM